MASAEKNTGTFVIKVMNRQNATWQGSVDWVERHETQYFRSALELLKLIDGALDGYEKESRKEGGSHEA